MYFANKNHLLNKHLGNSLQENIAIIRYFWTIYL